MQHHNTDITTILRRLPLFASLEANALASLASMATRKRYGAGSFLFFQGERPDRLIILAEGVLRLYKSADSGKEINLHTFSPVCLVAEAALLRGIPYPATALFETDGEVVLIDYAAFERMFLGEPRLAKQLILSLGEKIKMLESVIERGLMMNAAERVVDFLRRSPERMRTMRRYEVAAELHMTPENFSRTLKKLKSEGRIAEEADVWRVCDAETSLS